MGRAHGSRFKAYSIQIPYHRLPFWYNFDCSLLKRIGLFQFDFHHSFWPICIRIPCRIWVDLCTIFYLPLSTEMRSICIHVMNDFGFLWHLCGACIFASRVTFLADSPILSCADNISNQNGFGKVHLLLFNFQWDLDWDLRVLSQDWPLKSAQIGKNSVQFPANFYVSDCLNISEHVCSNACVSSIIMLLVCCFILKADLRKNWITLHFSHVHVYKQFLPRNLNITFALIEFHMRCFLQDLPLTAEDKI